MDAIKTLRQNGYRVGLAGGGIAFERTGTEQPNWNKVEAAIATIRANKPQAVDYLKREASSGITIRCGDCIHFQHLHCRKNHGSDAAFGKCTAPTSWDGWIGQWPLRQHGCENFKSRRSVRGQGPANMGPAIFGITPRLAMGVGG